MPSDIVDINHRVESMRRSAAASARDQHMDEVRQVRRGEIDQLFPDMFADDMPKSVVANIVDVAARNIAEKMAAMPALACVAGNMTTAADEARATRKNKIGSYYWQVSELPTQMFYAADAYNSYAFGALVVEPDFEMCTPRIRFESPFGAYYRKDRFGRVREYVKVTHGRAADLAAAYPEHAHKILFEENGRQRSGEARLEMIRYMDCSETVVYLPHCNNTILVRTKNLLSRLPVAIAERWDLEEHPRGAYDDVIWVQLARAIMALYQLKGTQIAVEAPIAVPDDVTQVNLGADAVMRSQNPQQIRRVNLDLPNQVFALSETLDRESKTGARYPDSRTGGMQASIITGRGIQELQDTIADQVQTSQVVFSRALQEATSLCFEMDTVLWGSHQKKICGFFTGKPFEMTYTPGKDIGESWTCKVQYGFTAGMTPAQASVMLLQLRGDQWVSRDTARRMAPIEIDPDEEQRAVDQEQMEGALQQGFSSLLQSLGPMVMQGQNPMQVLLGAAKAIELRQAGKSLHEAILTALTPEEKPAEPAAPGAPPGPGQGLPPGVGPDGLPQGVAPGQAGMAPGGMPAISSLMAELRGDGSNRMSAGVMRKRAIGTG